MGMVRLFDDDDMPPPLLGDEDDEPYTSHLSQVHDQLPYWVRWSMGMVRLFDDDDMPPPLGDEDDEPFDDDDMPPLLGDEDDEPYTSHLSQVHEQLPYALRWSIMTKQETVALSEILPSEQMAPHFYTVRDLTCDNHSSHSTWCWSGPISPCTPTIILMSPIISTDDEDSDDKDAG